jgi:type IV secretory pathway VirB2 component (pilin)
MKKYFKRVITLLLCPMSAFAESDKLTEILDNAVNYAQSGPARGFCLLAIVGSGYLWLGKGMLPKSWAVGIIGGSGFIFGASYIGQFVLGLS